MAAMRERLVILPTPLTRFIGREREVAAVAGMLRREQSRFLTLTGPGGVGKTRLALRVAQELGGGFADGTAFVPLAAVRDVDLVMPTIMQALGVRDDEEQSARLRLTAFLRDRAMLLVLDNLEQVTDIGPALRDVLTSCPNLTLLLTSRSPLHVPGERIFPVSPLALPAPRATTGGVVESEAVELFVDRARAASVTFALTAENAGAVRAICQRTDGLPLAIELAAARTRVLAPADLLARLSAQLPLLTGGPRNQPARLRTMRDAIAWSYDLLDPSAQRLFRGLAVFASGFTLDAAELVAGSGSEGGRWAPSSMLDLLTSLVDASLVRCAEGQKDSTRYTMLETVREFGAERLAASGEEWTLRDAHADWQLAFAERAAPELAGPDHVAWFNRIEAEIGNIRAAHAWLFERGDAGRALRLGTTLAWFWQAAGYFQEGRALFARLLAMPDTASFPELLVPALDAAGSIAHHLGDLERAREFVERALRLAQDRGDERAVIAARRTLGSIAVDRGDLLAAEQLLGVVAVQGPGHGATWEVGSADYLLGVVAFTRGDYEAAMRHAEAARDTWQALGDTGHAGVAQIAWARAAFAAGDAQQAAILGHDVLSQLHDVEDDAITADCLDLTAGLAWAGGDVRTAARLLAAAHAMRTRIGTPRRAGYETWFQRLRDDLRSGLGEPSFIEVWSAGEALALHEATAAAFAMFERLANPSVRTAGGPEASFLTTRERTILFFLVDGLSDKEIAAALGISRHTVSNHVAAIRDKLGAPSRAGAVAIALRDGVAPGGTLRLPGDEP